jgi:hypothetical protein
MSGISGSGKSSFAINMTNSWPAFVSGQELKPVILSADNYHMVNGEYKFDPKNIGLAHRACLQEFLKFTKPNHGLGLLIVDNTNTTPDEIAPYYRVAEALNHDVSIIRILMDPFQAFKRNRHGVPLATVLQQHKRIVDSVIPYGWKIEHHEAWEGDA